MLNEKITDIEMKMLIEATVGEFNKTFESRINKNTGWRT